MTGLPFADRRDAGARLGARIAALDPADPVVLGLARGGVVVAAEVARVLGAPLDVLVARKIGHPRQPEFGVGAIAEGGEPVFDQDALDRLGLDPGDLGPIVAQERQELTRRVGRYRGGRPLPPLAGRTVVLVDDGVATGVTARAALRMLREHGPARLVLAAPVAAAEALRELAGDADELVALAAPSPFEAVGRWYAVFGQVSDDQVAEVLVTPPGRRSR